MAPRLAGEIRKIPSAFLERLATREQFTLKPGMATTRLTHSEEIAALEWLAAAYITTQTLLEQLAPAEIETDQWPDTLRRQAERIAMEAVGFDPEQARIFAGHYAELVSQDRKILQAWIK
ncbi:MAG: hypothetical protein JW850_13725 [Thermoflexales bacterium]|nr:hypothetical protein [Thermoflexales bacterium]